MSGTDFLKNEIIFHVRVLKAKGHFPIGLWHNFSFLLHCRGMDRKGKGRGKEWFGLLRTLGSEHRYMLILESCLSFILFPVA